MAEATDPGIPAEIRGLVDASTSVSTLASLLATASLAAALAEQGFVDPGRVAFWAEAHGSNLQREAPSVINAYAAAQLQGFATFMRTIKMPPPGSRLC